ncbi:MAG: putative toxin-antitoxin system toxin component, PIN family [Acidaminococcaceae bacterium]|nr:putative toxin-antitoxin system toxin component, PIN family [Acidaminococcaceae bacterium]
MKVFIDTNVLFSTFISPNGTAAKAFVKAVSGENVAVICRQNIDELEATIGKKYPDKMKSLEVYLSILSSVVEIVEVPNFLTKSETLIRDIKDRPILRAAIFANVDVIVTGDKDFLEADIEWPLIMSPAEFVSYYPTPPDNPLYVAEP